ncbi:hypothetical protein ACFLVZ_00535 [Chloroflexota bacterium]
MPRRKKKGNENQAGNFEVTSLSFNRLGAILLEIVQNEANTKQVDRDNCPSQEQKPIMAKLREVKASKHSNPGTNAMKNRGYDE